MALKIAAKVDKVDEDYFRHEILPLIDSPGIEFIGEINEREKTKFLGEAAVLLFPVDWPEPFGLVMIEAMACGTSVLAFRCGSIPEVIDDGITGTLVNSEEEAIATLPGILTYDRHVSLCRRRVRGLCEAQQEGACGSRPRRSADRRPRPHRRHARLASRGEGRRQAGNSRNQFGHRATREGARPDAERDRRAPGREAHPHPRQAADGEGAARVYSQRADEGDPEGARRRGRPGRAHRDRGQDKKGQALEGGTRKGAA